jgi:hypothetical protein
MITDLFLRKVERLPDDIIKFIHEFLDIETRIKILTYKVVPTGIQYISTSILLKEHYSFNGDGKYSTSEVFIKNKPYNLFQILSQIRFCDLKQFYRHIYKLCNRRYIFPDNVHFQLQRGNGTIYTVYHPIVHELFRTDVECLHYSQYYMNEQLFERKYNNHYIKTLFRPQIRVFTLPMQQKCNPKNSLHFKIVKELYLLILLFTRNFQNLRAFVPDIDNTLRETLYIFLREFLNSSLIARAIWRIQFSKCMTEFELYQEYLKRKRIKKYRLEKAEKIRIEKEKKRKKSKERKQNEKSKIDSIRYIRKLFVNVKKN